MNAIEKKLLDILSEPKTKNAVYGGMSGEAKSDVDDAIASLISRGALISDKGGKLGVPAAFGLLTGVYRASGRGYGFVIRDDGAGSDVFIPPKRENGAWHGDRVVIRVSDAPDGRSEGDVVRIAEKSQDEIVGRFVKKGPMAYIVPDSRFVVSRINILRGAFKSAKDGEKVSVRVVSRGNKKGDIPTGEVTAVFGMDGELSAAVAARLHVAGINKTFPADVLEEISGLPDDPCEKDFSDRLDLRNALTFTIDGEDAKDFDDAVSLEKRNDGSYLLGVHIADVSHYVKEGSPLDREAYSRGTSVYFADRVIPMLPEKLSNGLCSLNPGVDRLCFSIMMDIGKDGAVRDFIVKKSVIRSSERMTYTDCNKLLDGSDAALSERYGHITNVLKTMKELSDIIRSARNARGALDLDLPESKIACDERGLPIDVRPQERGDSERMVEDFMLIANETVAQFLFDKKHPNVYRVHDKPTIEKIAFFKQFAANFGYSLKIGGKEISPADLQKILESVRGKPEERAVSTMLLRSLARAKYSPECLGHFGLAAKFYCHFTSPIRRYPDLMTHRMLFSLISGDEDPSQSAAMKAKCEKAAEASTLRETAADDAEREIEKCYKAAFMALHIGEEFDGIISSVAPFGFFVELPSTVEGMVTFENMDEPFLYDDEKLVLEGEITGKKFTIGMPVRVRCVSSSIDAGEVGFALL